MPSRKQPLIEWMFYHVFNRGFGKETIFFEPRDYKRFVENMVKYKQEFDGIQIYVWCLLPNHFHMLLKSDKSGLEISAFMKKLQQAYAMYFKTKYKSLSPDLNLLKFPQLFEWRFKAKLIDNEDYLNKVATYIALNPIKHWIVEKTEDWEWKQSPDSLMNLSPDSMEDMLDELEF